MPLRKRIGIMGVGGWPLECLAGLEPASLRYATQRDTSYTIGTLTLPMPEGRGFLVRQPLRRLRRIGVLHDFPKREFPCAPRYIFISAYAAVDLSSKALRRIFFAAFTSLS